MKKIVLFILITLIGIQLPVFSTYNKEKASEFATKNALSKSHTCCAWFVMRALQEGGINIGLYPAYMYKNILPYYGFKEVSKTDYIPQQGDIVVFPKVDKHIWGHIAIYNGNQWISDYKQKGIIVSKAYTNTNYKIYRYG